MRRTALLLLLTITACEKHKYHSADPGEANNIAKSLTYLRDPRTGLCFAYVFESRGNHQGGPALAHVPCDRVEHLLNNGVERAPGRAP